ncbi:MAG: type II toxin-antitoxin system RelE/ParE family toxin [Pirellulaceae bacterium]|nr:type II toxin-antitoxin system RelE/ParE family toxin [Pirellulaceae bacterium]
MAQLRWSLQAAQDLEDICDFLAQDSPQFACVFAQRAMTIIESIPDQPRLGSIVPEYNRSELRERLLYNYRIIYRVQGEIVQIVTITHGARLLASDLLSEDG